MKNSSRHFLGNASLQFNCRLGGNFRSAVQIFFLHFRKEELELIFDNQAFPVF